MNKEIIATKIFQQFGLNFETATRAGGWTNAVWFNGDLVLRLSLTKASSRIRHEIQLAQMLPAAVGYPVNVSKGVVEDYEWSISKRIKGMNLSEAWPGLSWEEKAHAVKQIWDMMQAVHTVDIEAVKDLSSKNPWYSSLNPDETLPKFECYIEKGIFTSEQGAILSNILKRFWSKLPSAKVVLNHGDITTDNILWNEGDIVSLMDFEHSVIAPMQIDLNSVINLAFFNEEGNTPVEEKNNEEFQKYKSEIKQLIEPVLKQPDCIDLLLGFVVLFNQRFLDFWIEDPEGSLADHKPYNKLVSLTNNHGGYLSQIFDL